MRLVELTQLGRGDSANNFCERDMKYGTAKLKVAVVIKPQRDLTAAAPSPTAFGEHMATHNIVHRQSQIPAVTAQQRKYSKEPRFGETTVTQNHTGSLAQCSAGLDTDLGCEAC
jgi:hypothetical protein